MDALRCVRIFTMAGGLSLLALAGCLRPLINTGDVAPVTKESAEIEESVPLVGDWAGPWGLRPVRVEAVALVTGLSDTGSDPAPSAERDLLFGDMQARDVRNPNGVLASPQTAMVKVTGYLPAAVRKGDRIDLEIKAPPRSETTSLDGGWLMETRLQEMGVLGGQVRSGHLLAVAQGHVLPDATLYGSQEDADLRSGRVLGGGVATKDRPLGLALRSDHQSVRKAMQISQVINRRFHTFDSGNQKQGVAKPLRDTYIELSLYPRYKDNLARYVRVVSAIPLRQRPQQHVRRMELLAAQLLSPTTSAAAAIKLEAIGNESIGALRAGLESEHDEVRFYAAEALAYLDQGEAAPVLAELLRKEPAFRWHALTALSAMNDMTAYDELVDLLNVESVETRYGVFRALIARGPADPLVKGESLGNQFMYHQIASEARPLVHISRVRRPEIVVFGNQVQLQTPLVLFTENRITIRSIDGQTVRVSRFVPGEESHQATCSNSLDDVVRTLVQVGASYADVVSVLQLAKEAGKLNARVEVNALPTPGRTYTRASDDAADAPSVDVASPMPSLFGSLLGRGDEAE